MWSQTFRHTTPARTERLWAVLADVDGWVRWNDGIERIALDAPLAVGATFQMTPPGEETITSTIVALEPPRLLTDSTELGGITVRVEHRLDPGPNDAATIVFAVSVTGDAPDNVLAEIGAGVSSDFPAVMAGLASAAESA